MGKLDFSNLSGSLSHSKRHDSAIETKPCESRKFNQYSSRRPNYSGVVDHLNQQRKRVFEYYENPLGLKKIHELKLSTLQTFDSQSLDLIDGAIDMNTLKTLADAASGSVSR